MFYIPSQLQENFVSFQMNIKQNVNDFCDSFHLNLFYLENYSIQSKISINLYKLNDLQNFFNIQYYPLNNPLKEFNFTDNKNLLVCKEWFSIWMIFHKNKQIMNFGVGKTLNEKSLFAIPYNLFNLKLLKIGLFNEHIQSITSVQIHNFCGETVRLRNNRICGSSNAQPSRYLNDYNLDTCLAIEGNWNLIERYHLHRNCSYGKFNSTARVIFRYSGDNNDLISNYSINFYLSENEDSNIMKECQLKTIENKLENFQDVYFDCSRNTQKIKKLAIQIFKNQENNGNSLEICHFRQ